MTMSKIMKGYIILSLALLNPCKVTTSFQTSRHFNNQMSTQISVSFIENALYFFKKQSKTNKNLSQLMKFKMP